MAGQGSPGVALTPNPNVNAPAGVGGQLWGANGGGITPYTGSDSLAGTQSRGQTAANFQTAGKSLAEQESDAALGLQTLDANIASGGSNQG